MAKFSERYGYVNPAMVLIRETMTKEIVNAICTCYDLLREAMGVSYNDMEKHVWCYFLNKRLNNFTYHPVLTQYIENNNLWHQKLDMIEHTLSYLINQDKTSRGFTYREYLDSLVAVLNFEFKRLNFAYRIIENQVVEVTSEEEIVEIETALQNPSKGVQKHLHTALELLSKRPDGDYRNSIKESVSAIEAAVREITGANTLDFKKLETSGIVLPSVLKKSFELLYGYTNDKSTGIRHALMDDTNAPGADEAIFMLVSCSAFINYLTKKNA